MIFSVDLSWLVPYPQFVFQGHTKNQRLVKSSNYFSYRKAKKTPHAGTELFLFAIIRSRLRWPGALGTPAVWRGREDV